MEIGEALYAHLAATTALSALIGTKIYPVSGPQNVDLPMVTYQMISGIRIHASISDPGLTRPRFQISSWSTSYSICKAVATQVRIALQDYSGNMGSTISTVPVQRIFHDNEIDLQDTSDGRVTYQNAQDFIIWHTSST